MPPDSILGYLSTALMFHTRTDLDVQHHKSCYMCCSSCNQPLWAAASPVRPHHDSCAHQGQLKLHSTALTHYMCTHIRHINTAVRHSNTLPVLTHKLLIVHLLVCFDRLSTEQQSQHNKITGTAEQSKGVQRNKAQRRCMCLFFFHRCSAHAMCMSSSSEHCTSLTQQSRRWLLMVDGASHPSQKANICIIAM